jgi:hypothetical protein
MACALAGQRIADNSQTFSIVTAATISAEVTVHVEPECPVGKYATGPDHLPAAANQPAGFFSLAP